MHDSLDLDGLLCTHQLTPLRTARAITGKNTRVMAWQVLPVIRFSVQGNSWARYFQPGPARSPRNGRQTLRSQDFEEGGRPPVGAAAAHEGRSPHSGASVTPVHRELTRLLSG